MSSRAGNQLGLLLLIWLRLKNLFWGVRWLFSGEETTEGGIAAFGSREFVRRFSAAIGLLRHCSPEMYQTVVAGLGTVTEWHGPAVWVEKGRGCVLVGPRMSRDVESLAGYLASAALQIAILSEEAVSGPLSEERKERERARMASLLTLLRKQLANAAANA
jgi:hypothetical protein